MLAWAWVTACKRRSHRASSALRKKPADLCAATSLADPAIRRLESIRTLALWNTSRAA
jgi:hypothetical protein